MKDTEDPLLNAAALLTLHPLQPHQLLTPYPRYRHSLLTLVPHLQLYVLQLLEDFPKHFGTSQQAERSKEGGDNSLSRSEFSTTTPLVALRTGLECLQFCNFPKDRLKVSSVVTATMLVLKSMETPSKERLEFLSTVREALLKNEFSTLTLERNSFLSHIVDLLADFAIEDLSAATAGALSDIFLLGFAANPLLGDRHKTRKSALPDLSQFLESASLIPDFLANIKTLTTQEAREHLNLTLEKLRISHLRISYLYLLFCAIYVTRRAVGDLDDDKTKRRILALLAYDIFQRLSSNIQLTDLTMFNNYSIQLFNILNMRARPLAQFGFQSLIDKITTTADKNLKASSEYKTFLDFWELTQTHQPDDDHHHHQPIWTPTLSQHHSRDSLYNADATEREMELVKIIEASLPPNSKKVGKGYLLIALRVAPTLFPNMPIDLLVEELIHNPANFTPNFPKDLQNIPLNLTFQKLKEFLVARQNRKIPRAKKADLSDIPRVPRDVQNKTLSLVRAQQEAEIAAEEAMEVEFGEVQLRESQEVGGEEEEAAVVEESVIDQQGGRGRRGGRGRGSGVRGRGFRRRTRPRDKHVDPFRE